MYVLVVASGGRGTLARIALAVAAALGPLAAQCDPLVSTGPGSPGPDAGVIAMCTWDRDGAGPLPPVVVMAGAFTVVGNQLANHIVTYDPSTGLFALLGSGLDGDATCLAIAANGDLLVGGRFATAGGVSANRVARWNGSTWAPLGAGIPVALDSDLLAIAVLANGDVVVGGAFADAGGVATNHLARWDGAAWWPMPGLPPSTGQPPVRAMVVMDNGDLVVGGYFASIGGVAANSLARWDGNAWSAFGSGLSFATPGTPMVRALAKLPGNALAVGGQFAFAGGNLVNHVARWDGSAWSGMNAGMQPGTFALVQGLATLPNGDLVACGSFQAAGGQLVNHVARWNGTTWSAFGNGAEAAVASVLPLAGGDLLVGSGWIVAAPRRWNGSEWRLLGSGFAPGFAGSCTPLLRLADGRLLFAVNYQTPSQPAFRGLFAYDGVSWTPFGGGVGGYVNAAVQLANGDVVVAGQFPEAGGVPAANIARWNGSAWSPVGVPACDGYVSGLGVLPNGDLVAGGVFTVLGGVAVAHLARWNGAAWSGIGGGVNGNVAAVLVQPNGDVVVGGLFSAAGAQPASRIARWDGANWLPFGSGMNGNVYDLVRMPNGDLVASGQFTDAGGVAAQYVARWNGTSWSAFPPGFDGAVEALTVLPGGDLAVGGRFTTAGGVAASRLVRWNGQAWSPLLAGSFDYTGVVTGLLVLPEGEVLVGGNFKTFAGQAAVQLLRLTPTCPATVSSWGTGCAGSGGTDALAATSLPWIGAAAAATATGLAANGLAVDVLGFTAASMPLASVLPPSGPGCVLRVVPEVLRVLVPAAGAATTSFPVPSSAVLVGIVVHEQVVALELDAAAAIVDVTAGNRLTWTIGRW